MPSASFITVFCLLCHDNRYGAYIASPIGCLPQHGDSDICNSGYIDEATDFFNRTDWRSEQTKLRSTVNKLHLESAADSCIQRCSVLNCSRYVYTNGKEGVPPSGPAHTTPSTAFDWAGQITMRSGYDRNATWVWFDNGPYGSNAFHAHRDKLGLLSKLMPWARTQLKPRQFTLRLLCAGLPICFVIWTGILMGAFGSKLLHDSGRFAYAGTSFSHSLRP